MYINIHLHHSNTPWADRIFAEESKWTHIDPLWQDEFPGTSWMMMMMMMMMTTTTVLCPKAGSLAFTPSRDKMSEVVSSCLPHRQLWLINLSKVATQWLEVDSNLRPSSCKTQNIPLPNRIPSTPPQIFRVIYSALFYVQLFSKWAVSYQNRPSTHKITKL